MMKRTVLTVCIALAVLSMGLSTRSPAEDIKTMGQAIEYLKTLDPEKIPEEEQQ